MPKIAEFANIVLDLVSEEFEITKEQILSKSRNAEIVDARHMAVKLMHAHNIYTSRIATILGISQRNTLHIITSFDTRIQMNRSLRNSYAKITKKLGENFAADWI